MKVSKLPMFYSHNFTRNEINTDDSLYYSL